MTEESENAISESTRPTSNPSSAMFSSGGQIKLEQPLPLPATHSDTSFLFHSPPPIPPKPSSIALSTSVASPHSRSASSSTQVSFMRWPGDGSSRTRSPISMVAQSSTTSLPATTGSNFSKSITKPPLAAKPSWLKRTTSGSKAIANSFGIGGPPKLPPRTSNPRDVEFLSPLTKNGNLQDLNSMSIPTELEDAVSIAPPSSPSLSECSSIVPPPPRRLAPASLPTRGRSEDTPRRLGSPNLNNLAPKSTAGALSNVNRKFAQWSDEAASGSSGSIASKGAQALKSAPASIGNAVSNGWSTWRGSKPTSSVSANQLSAPSSSIGSSFPPFGRKASFGSASPSQPELGVGDRDGPVLSAASIKRHGKVGVKGEVFGVDPTLVAQRWPAAVDQGPVSRRRSCLPAVALRCVDYLDHWAPKEEGIFRISGRSTHVALLRKQFDSGADIELVGCDPGDVDPHSVASLYKAYFRELPNPILTTKLSPKFDTLLERHLGVRATEQDFGAGGMATLQVAESDAKAEGGKSPDPLNKALKELLDQLPDTHWYLLSDLARLLGKTAQYSYENKMTLSNLLMVFCPSLSLTPPFLRQLIQHHSTLFIDTSTAPAPQLPPRPSNTQEILAPIAQEQRRSILLSKPDSRSVSTPPTQTSLRYSTPIADRFARTGPITLTLRDKPAP